ncbi:MAG: glycosyltransferase family 39 protein, partial [Deltaproteobacteria bacterium]|nr:glycosyltransferase family 39 protein [Deltaproteobacteria bacterium]
PGLMDPDEGRYAEIAREMLVLKDWLVPHLNFFPYLEKPPLVYWFTALSFKGIGYTELAARLPSAVSAVGGLFLAYGLGRVMWGPAAAFLGATVLATCSGYVALGRILTLDMTFSFLVNLGIGLGYLALRQEQSRLWPWAYGVLALAVLTKGPVALILAGLIWGLWVVIEGRSWKLLIRPWSWLLLAVLVLPWFAYLQWRIPEYFHYFILEQNFGRFLTPAIHPQPGYFFGPVLLGLLLPWTFLLPWALWGLGQGRDPDRVFLLIWAAVVLVFFSLSRGKLPPYILPALLPLALLLGQRLAFCSDALRNWTIDRGLRLSLWAWTGAGLILVGLALWPPLPLMRALTRANLSLPYVLLVAAVFALTPLLALAGRRFNLLLLGVGALILSSLLPVGLERLSQERSPRELGRLVRSGWQSGDALVGAYLYSQGLSFYSGQVLHLMEGRTELDFGRKLAPERQRELVFASVGEMAQFARSRPKVFFYLKETDLESLRPELPGQMQILARQGDCLLLAYKRE